MKAAKFRLIGAVVAVSAVCAACGARQDVPAATAAAIPTTAPAQSAPPTAGPSTASALWISGDPLLGEYTHATDGQCGSALVVGKTFSFALSYTRGSCVRNQIQPLENGSLQTLVVGDTYTFTFRYVDGDIHGKAPGMGSDRGDSRSLLWQIHAQPDTYPCTYLGFTNGPDGLTAPQYWLLTDCGPNAGDQAYRWTGPYTQGAAVDWTIQVKVATDASGFVRLFKDGVLVFNDENVKTVNRPAHGSLPPWWNFGPYKWTWANDPTSSAMTSLNATFSYFDAYRGLVSPVQAARY